MKLECLYPPNQMSLPALWPSAPHAGLAGHNNRLVTTTFERRGRRLAPALQGPPPLVIKSERPGALFCHDLLVQIVGGLVAAGPALHGPSVVAVHGQELQTSKLLSQVESGGRLQACLLCIRCCCYHLHLLDVATERMNRDNARTLRMTSQVAMRAVS